MSGGGEDGVGEDEPAAGLKASTRTAAATLSIFDGISWRSSETSQAAPRSWTAETASEIRAARTAAHSPEVGEALVEL